jgi:hypothetical protein
MLDEIDFVSWKIVQWVLWSGPFGVAAFLGVIIAAAFFAGYSMRPKPDRPMGAQKLDHIKTDILPDGTLGPGDNRGLEGSE